MAIGEHDTVYVVFKIGRGYANDPFVHDERVEMVGRLPVCNELYRRQEEAGEYGIAYLYRSDSSELYFDTIHGGGLRKETRVPGTSIIRHTDWSVSFYPEEFVEFHVTGVDVYGKRFKQVHKYARWAFGVNLYKGTVWGVLPTGRRIKLKEAWN